MKAKVTATQARLSAADYRLLTLLAQQLELSQAQVIRKAIREFARKQKIK